MVTASAPETFGSFQLLAKLGSGGMSETFVAVGPDGVRVCLKRMREEVGGEDDLAELFEREAPIVARMRHPNIVALRDVGVAGTRRWITFELVDGVDLRVVLFAMRARGERLPVEMVVYVTTCIAKALEHAHASRGSDGAPLGLVHRDVSPSNVLLGYDGSVKLADFGLARVASQERTRSKDMRGKAPYVSPEQSLGDVLDGRADLFALGVTLYEMLGGARPYDGATDVMTMANAVAGRGKPLRDLARHAPPGLVHLAEQLIRSDREKRPWSAGDVLYLLARHDVSATVGASLGELVASLPRR